VPENFALKNSYLYFIAKARCTVSIQFVCGSVTCCNTSSG